MLAIAKVSRLAPRRFLGFARNTEKVIELRVCYCVCDTRSTVLADPCEGLESILSGYFFRQFPGVYSALATLVLNDVRTRFRATLPTS